MNRKSSIRSSSSFELSLKKPKATAELVVEDDSLLAYAPEEPKTVLPEIRSSNSSQKLLKDENERRSSKLVRKATGLRNS